MDMEILAKLWMFLNGGEGSGNHGHGGRPGKIGGSSDGTSDVESVEDDVQFDSDNFDEAAWRKEYKELQSGTTGSIYGRALAVKAMRDYNGKVLLSKMDGKVVSALSYDVNNERLNIRNVGSVVKGEGKNLLSAHLP